MKVRCLLVVAAVLFVAGVLATSSYAKIDPKTCVGMWLFDEGNGDTAVDSSGNGNDGTLKNGPEWIDGKFGDALEFDGATAFVDCGNADILNITKAITVTSWVYPNTIPGQHGIVNGSGTYGGSYELFLRNEAGRMASFWFNNASQRMGLYPDNVNVEDNAWTHVAGVYDGTNIYLYINGVQYSKAPATGVEAVNYSGVRIGHISWIAAPQYFNGIIDEVAIFNAALSTEDIQTVMNKGLKESLSPTAVDLSGKLTTTWADIKAKI